MRSIFDDYAVILLITFNVIYSKWDHADTVETSVKKKC